LNSTYAERIAALGEVLGTLPGGLVAFSGGVDSTALLWAAVVALGRERVVAVTADSPSYPRAELKEASELAQRFAVRHVVLQTSELEREGYRQNANDRCYFCKTELFESVASLVRAAGLPDWPVLYGAIAEDADDHRPGHRAASEHGVRAPLAEVGLRKDEVRRYSREQGLPTAEKPSFACLSSRVPYGTVIDAGLLYKLECAEGYLRDRGFRQFRVRHHGMMCRIEVDGVEIDRAAGPERVGIVQAMRELGYVYVSLDLQGFRTGSMNEGTVPGSRLSPSGTGLAPTGERGTPSHES
jgi:uncharacterized protein